MPTTVSELVVVGQRLADWPVIGLPPGAIALDSGHYGIWQFLPDGSPNPDYPTSPTTDPVIKWEIDPSTPEMQELARRLANRIVEIRQKVLAIPDSNVIQTSAGPLQGTQAKSAMEWIFSSPVRVVYNGAIPGAVGAQHQAAVRWEGQPPQPVLYVAPALLGPDGYGGNLFQGDTGLNFVILHEIAHITTPVQQQTNQAYQDFMSRMNQPNLNGFYDADSTGTYIHPEPRAAEQFANNTAYSLGNYVGLALPPTSSNFPKYGT